MWREARDWNVDFFKKIGYTVYCTLSDYQSGYEPGGCDHDDTERQFVKCADAADRLNDKLSLFLFYSVFRRSRTVSLSCI